jgi:hypothetical protein
VLSVALTLALAQANLRAVVVDVSAPDAVYEDVSRGLAEQVSLELLKKGFLAKRVDESELPTQGCRIGPCLGEIARTQGADVLVLLDATEAGKDKIDVSLTAMRGRDGLPLSAGKWSTTTDGKPNKQLAKFVTATSKAASKHVGGAP